VSYQGNTMKQFLLSLAVSVLFSFTAVAQTGSSSARTPDTGAEDMSTWSKAAKSPTQKERKTQVGQNAAEPSSAASGVLTGCLGQDEGEFMLATAGNKKVEVKPDTGVDLKSHVGHKVRLSGRWEKTENSGGNETAQTTPGERHFAAAKADHIAGECKAPAAIKRRERTGR
jgi:hypothetical protein